MSRRGFQAAVSPAHIGPAPDPEDWWSYKDNLQGNFVPGAARAGTQASGQPGFPPETPESAPPLPPPAPPHPQDPGVLAPSFLPPEAQPLTPGGSAWDIIHAHFESGVGVSGRQGSVGVEECVCACWERPGRSWLVLRTRGSGPGSPPGPALSCNSFSPVHSSTSCGIRETEELQLPWALGQAGRGWVGWPPHRLLGVVVSSPKTTDDRFDQREAWRCWG